MSVDKLVCHPAVYIYCDNIDQGVSVIKTDTAIYIRVHISSYTLP